MNELDTQQQPTNEPSSPTPDVVPEKKPVGERNRLALVRYMAILFAVAFVLVLLSLLMQMRSSQSTINDLNKASANAMANAEQLQQTNQSLIEQNQTLQSQVDKLQKQLEEQTEQWDGLQDTLTQKTDALQASETLLQALLARAEDDRDGLDKAMQALSAQKEHLSQEGQALYAMLQKEQESNT